MTKRIFIDSDVFIDVFSQREHFYKSSSQLLTLAELNVFQAYTSPLIIANIVYVLQKFGKKELAIHAVRKIRSFTNIVEMNQRIVDQAMAALIPDFEDAMEIYSAEHSAMDIIVTRNIKDYKSSKISLMSPIEALALFE